MVELKGPIKRGDGIVLDRGKWVIQWVRKWVSEWCICGRKDVHTFIHKLHTGTYALTHTYPLSLPHTVGNPEEKEEGGAVYEVLDSRGRPVEKGEEVESGKVTLSFGRWVIILLHTFNSVSTNIFAYICLCIYTDRYFPHFVLIYFVLSCYFFSYGPFLIFSMPFFFLPFASPSNAVDYSRISIGDIIWRNKDPALDSRMKAYTEKNDNQVLKNAK